jgi:ABC-type transport system substrate-binding protein
LRGFSKSLIPYFIIVILVFTGCNSDRQTVTETTTIAPQTTTTTIPATTTTSSTPTTTELTSTITPTTSAAAPAPWGTIRVAVTDFGIEETDPTLHESTWGRAIYDSIITTNAQGELIGKVAEGWTINPDGKTWTFNLRKDIKFHNGDPLTSADVLFTMNRLILDQSQNPWSPGLRNNLDHMETPDDYTFIFVTKVPELPLSAFFAAVYVLPKNYFESVGQDAFRLNPVGSGPWKFVEHIPETTWKITANTNYWDPALIPSYEFVVETQVLDMATQIAMFKNGEIDVPLGITSDIRFDLINQHYKQQWLGLASPVVLNIQGTWFTHKTFATHDIRIRKAMSYAINRQELCDTYYRGMAVPGGKFALMPGGKGAGVDIIAPDPYDITQAKALLSEANYPAAFKDPVIHMYTTAGPDLEFMRIIQRYWDAIGLQTRIEVVDAKVWRAYTFNPVGMTENSSNIGWVWSWTGGDFDSTYMQRNHLTSYGVSDMVHLPAVDALWNKFIAETDPALSDQYFEDFLRAGYANYDCIGLVLVEPYIIVSDKLGEWTKNIHQGYTDAYAGIKHPAGASPANPIGIRN